MSFVATKKFTDMAVLVGWLFFGTGLLLRDSGYGVWLQFGGLVISGAGIVRQWIVQQSINRAAMANGDRN